MVSKALKCYNPPPNRACHWQTQSCPKESEPSGGFRFEPAINRYFDRVRASLLLVACGALNLSRIFGSDILFLLRPHRLVRSRTQGFHPWNRGSNPLGVMSSATPRFSSRRVSFFLTWLIFASGGLAAPPFDPVSLSEIPDHQDPRSSLMASALSQTPWIAPDTPVPWTLARVGDPTTVRGQVVQQGGFPHPWRDLEEWFVSTEDGTVAVYMKVPSERPTSGTTVQLRGWRWPVVAVEGRGGTISPFEAMLAYDWQPEPVGFPAWGVPVVGTGLVLFLLHWVRRWSRFSRGTVASERTPRAGRVRSDLPSDPAQALATLRDQVDSPADQEGSECQANSHSIPEEDQPGSS